MTTQPQLPIPDAAVDAAAAKVPDHHLGFPGGWEPAISRDCVRQLLEVAAPHLRQADRNELIAETADEVSAIAQATVLEAVAASTTRVTTLELLARDMMACFQLYVPPDIANKLIAKWQAVLDGSP